MYLNKTGTNELFLVPHFLIQIQKRILLSMNIGPTLY